MPMPMPMPMPTPTRTMRNREMWQPFYPTMFLFFFFWLAQWVYFAVESGHHRYKGFKTRSKQCLAYKRPFMQ